MPISQSYPTTWRPQEVLSQAYIPASYAVAMAVDRVFAIFIGKYYDRKGLSSLLWTPVLSIPVAWLGFSKSPAAAITSAVLWGCVMSLSETIMKAAIADMTSISNRGKAFGLFNTIYGIALMLGSVIMGYLYAYSIYLVVVFAIVVEVMAILSFVYFQIRYGTA